MPDFFWLQTARLALRRFTPADLDWLAALRADPEVMRYVDARRIALTPNIC